MPCWTTLIIAARIVSAEGAPIALRQGPGATVSMTVPSRSRTSATTCGVGTRPSFATPAATSAICNGVACTSF